MNTGSTVQDLAEQIVQFKKILKLYEEILDKVMQGVYVVSKNREIVWFNRLMQKVDGINRKEVLGKHEEAVFEYINDKVSTVSDTLRTGKRSKEKLLPYTTRTGRKVNATMQAFPLYYDNKLEYIYMLISYIDLSKKIINKKFHDSRIRIFNDTIFTLDSIVGSSRTIVGTVAKARRIASKGSPVLLFGETGTGKELFAQGIHNESLFKGGRFVAISCATIPENLMETLLFGSVKGAYTGAVDKTGLLEEAKGGTLFLDELDSLPLLLQGKLLRVLQENKASRIGDSKEYHIDCRIISATNQDPLKMVEKGILRKDLYYRLAVIPLEIPSLATRKEDIPELVEHFINIYNEEFELNVKYVDADVMDIFYEYSWPGNVRELEHVIEYMMNFANDQKSNLTIHELHPNLKKQSQYLEGAQKPAVLSNDIGNLHNALKEFEIKYLKRALENSQWNISQASRTLGIHREALYYRIKKYNLKKTSGNNKD